MKFSISILTLISLSGCVITQSTENQLTDTNHQKAPILVYTDALEQCEHNHSSHNDACIEQDDGVLPVVHPNDDVEIPLGKLPQNAEVSATDTVVTNTWFRIKHGLTFDIPTNNRLIAEEKWYLRHPAYMQRVANRAKPFLYYIVEELEANNMPLELALLPIVESAFDPFAYSHGRAAGMWQFIPSTGESYGMKQTWWYDGRRDVVASTKGAIKYLTRLQKMFDGNWLHALAAYNSGEGRVMRAIKKNRRLDKPIDFWSLDLPRETRAYVPKLLALAKILKDQETNAFIWPLIENVPVIDIVNIDSQIDLAMAADLAGLSTKELQALNPGFNRWATDPNGPNYLVLPISVSANFETRLANTPPKDRLNWVRHQVKSGESLGIIAKKYNTNMDVIKGINDMKSNTIYVNDYLMVPVSLQALDKYALSADQRLAKRQQQKQGNVKFNHVVKSGDTFWDLSRNYKVNMRELAKWNGMAPTDPLIPGKSLTIWTDVSTGDVNANAVLRSLTYTVRQGDSLARIANKFNIKIDDIAKWNSINARRYLQPGQKLKLIVDVTRT